MSRILVFLLCAAGLVSAKDVCRKAVPQKPTGTCGPQQTMFNEGMCLCCYYDTKDIPTIGVGFNLDRKDAAQVMSRYGIQLANVLKDCKEKTTVSCLTESNAKDLFNAYTYPEMAKCVDAYAPGLPAVKRAAVIDVAFAGCKSLHGHGEMQKALKKKDWAKAATELKYKSQWCRDVKVNRCNSDYNCIVSGCKGGSCGKLSSCSSNPECRCYTTSNGDGFCASPGKSRCSGYPDCNSCSPTTSVCLLNTCCKKPVCVPLSLADSC